MALFIYGVAANTGKGFFTEKTKSEAQALLKAADDLARTAWDNNNVDGESADEKVVRIGAKPGFVTIV